MSNQINHMRPNRSAWRNAVVDAVRSVRENGVSVERICKMLEPIEPEKIKRGVKRAAEGAEIVNIRKFQKVNGKDAFGIYVHADFLDKALVTIDGLTVSDQSAKNASTTKPSELSIAASAWQPTPGTNCRRAIVYMLTSCETHYRMSEISAALNITKSSAHDALRSAMKAGAVLSVPDPDHGVSRLYTIAPGWTLQHNPEVDTVEADPWPRQRWIRADGSVRMDRIGASHSAGL